MKKFINNVGFNIFANAAYLGLVQLILFPFLSRNFDNILFGEIVSLYGISNVLTDSIGGSLSSIRLLYDDKIKEKGNFTFLLKGLLVLLLLVSVIVLVFYANYSSLLDKTFFIIYVLFALIRIYLTTTFQIEFTYFKVVVAKLILVLGSIFGILFVPILNSWGVVFVIGELFSFIYLFFNSPFLKETPNKTKEFKTITKEFNFLIASKSLSSTSTYLDRFIMPPILGTYSLSIYYAATVVSKILSLLVTPMTNVLLSYMNKNVISNIRKKLIFSISLTSLLLIPIYIIINFISPYVIQILYPELMESAIQLVWITSLTTCFQVLFGITNTFNMASKSMKIQMIIDILFLIIYLPLSFILTSLYGLLGYAIGSLIAYCLKFLLSLVFIFYSPTKRGGVR